MNNKTDLSLRLTDATAVAITNRIPQNSLPGVVIALIISGGLYFSTKYVCDTVIRYKELDSAINNYKKAS